MVGSARFLHSMDTGKHIEAGLNGLKIGMAYRKEALDATEASEMTRLASLSKTKLVEGVGHLLAALTDPSLSDRHQRLLHDEIERYFHVPCSGDGMGRIDAARDVDPGI